VLVGGFLKKIPPLESWHGCLGVSKRYKKIGRFVALIRKSL